MYHIHEDKRVRVLFINLYDGKEEEKKRNYINDIYLDNINKNSVRLSLGFIQNDIIVAIMLKN